jgi:hypothetical protein
MGRRSSIPTEKLKTSGVTPPAFYRTSQIRLSKARASRTSIRALHRSALAAFEWRPCFVTACRMRSNPAAVFGPVLNPP